MNYNKTDFGAVLVAGLSYKGGIENSPINQTSYMSEPTRGDGLIHRASGQHTIQIHTINANATITIEATMDRDPNSGAWLAIPLTNTLTGEISATQNYVFTPPTPGIANGGKTVELNQFFLASGQYAWLRCNVTNMTNGIIDSVKMAF